METATIGGMWVYKKESLEVLRQRIDLVEVVSAHLQLRRAGSSYKALCPFHQEHTPSFLIQAGDHHYHCFGCGAHGDAIAFLMNYLKMSFVDAIETLAERFHVPLEKTEELSQGKGASRAKLKEALQGACQLYHAALLHTEEGHVALQYLYRRGLDLAFIRTFEVGFAPAQLGALHKALQMPTEILKEAGLLTETGRSPFADRITFPIRNAMGQVIGFSARKVKEETFGGKYINTPETPLFKKSQVLFGLSYCREQIMKQGRVILVEGQIDALRLIHAGFTYTVAGLGTAVGEGHVQELVRLGVKQAILAFDADEAGRGASVKVGHLLQKRGLEVLVLSLPEGKDPDTVLLEQGSEGFARIVQGGCDYLTFLYRHLSKDVDLQSPAQKSALVGNLAERIRSWEDAVLVHESLRRLCELAQVPESVVGVGQPYGSRIQVRREGSAQREGIDPDRIVESDLLRWLFLVGDGFPTLVQTVRGRLTEAHFRVPICRKFYSMYLDAQLDCKPCDLLSFALLLNEDEEQLFLTELMQKRVNLERAEVGITRAMQQLLVRDWMEEREAIQKQLVSGTCSEEQALALAQQFDEISRRCPAT